MTDIDMVPFFDLWLLTVAAELNQVADTEIDRRYWLEALVALAAEEAANMAIESAPLLREMREQHAARAAEKDDGAQ